MRVRVRVSYSSCICTLDVSNVAVLVDGVGVLGVDGPGTTLELSPRDRPGVNLGEDGAGRLHVVEGDGAWLGVGVGVGVGVRVTGRVRGRGRGYGVGRG